MSSETQSNSSRTIELEQTPIRSLIDPVWTVQWTKQTILFTIPKINGWEPNRTGQNEWCGDARLPKQNRIIEEKKGTVHLWVCSSFDFDFDCRMSVSLNDRKTRLQTVMGGHVLRSSSSCLHILSVCGFGPDFEETNQTHIKGSEPSQLDSSS